MRKHRTLLGIVVMISVLAISFGAFYVMHRESVPAADIITLGELIKLQICHKLDDTNDKAFSEKDAYGASLTVLGITKDTLTDSGCLVTDEDASNLQSHIQNAVKSIIDELECPGGHLNNFSKALVAEAVVGELKGSQAFPIDFDKRVSLSEFSYVKVAKLESLVQAMQENNAFLVESAKQANELLALIGKEDADKLKRVDIGRLEVLLNASATDVGVNSYTPMAAVETSAETADKAVGNRNVADDAATQTSAVASASTYLCDNPSVTDAQYERILDDLQKAVISASTIQASSLSEIEAQVQAVENLSSTVSATQSATKELKSNMSSLYASINETNNALGQVQLDISAVLSEMNASIESLKKDVVGVIANSNNDLNDKIQQLRTETDADLREAVDNIEQQLGDASLDDNSREKIEEALEEYKASAEKYLNSVQQSIQESLKSSVEKGDADTRWQLQMAKAELEKAIQSAEFDNKSQQQALREAVVDIRRQVEGERDALIKQIKDGDKAGKDELALAKNTLMKALNDADIKNSDARKAIEDAVLELQEATEEYALQNDAAVAKNKKSAEDALKKAAEDLTKSLQNSDKANKEARDSIKQTLDEFISSTNGHIQTINGSLGTLDAGLKNTSKDLTDVAAELRALIKANSDSIAALAETVEGNSDDIVELRQQVYQYMTASDSHSKIDSIKDVTVLCSGIADTASQQYVWASNGDGTSSVTIQSEFFLSATFVQVNYAANYDIEPIYSLDETTGTFKITVPDTQLRDINIDTIVIFHVVSENTIPPEKLQAIVQMAQLLNEEGFVDDNIPNIVNEVLSAQEQQNGVE